VIEAGPELAAGLRPGPELPVSATSRNGGTSAATAGAS